MSWRCRSKRGRQALPTKQSARHNLSSSRSLSTPISDKKALRVMMITHGSIVLFNFSKTEKDLKWRRANTAQVISCRGRIRHQVCLRGGHRPCNCWVSSPYVPPHHQAAGSGGVRKGSVRMVHPTISQSPVCVPPTCRLWPTKLSTTNL